MSNRKYNISLIAANILFGISYSIIVALLEGKFTPQQLFIIEILAGAAIFTPIALLRGRLHRITLAMLPKLILYSLVILYGWGYLTLMGGRATTAIDMAALSTLGPAVTIFAAAIESQKSRERAFQRSYCNDQSCIYYPRLKQIKPRRIQLLALPSALLLLVFLTIAHNTPAPISSAQLLGNLTITAAVVCFAASTTIVRHLQSHIGTSTMLAALFTIALIALPALIPNWLEELHAMRELSLSRREVVGLISLPTLGVSLPLYLLYRGAIHLTPLHTALYRYLQPTIAVAVLVTRRWGDGGAIYTEMRHLAATLLITLLLLTLATIIIPRWGGGYRAISSTP